MCLLLYLWLRWYKKWVRFPYDSCAGYQRQLSVLLVNRVPVEIVPLLAKCTGIGEGEDMLGGRERRKGRSVDGAVSQEEKTNTRADSWVLCSVFISLTNNFHPQPLFDHN